MIIKEYAVPVRHHDAVVVGSRCAGAATAMLLARRGYDVALVDRSSFPSDTLSTHAISRAGVVQLNRWGLLPEVVDSGAPPVRSVSFHLPDQEPVVRAIKESAGVDHLLAPRRFALDQVLRAAAIRAGASVRTATVTDVLRDPSGRVTGVHLRTRGGSEVLTGRIVVGADGRASRLAHSFGAPLRHHSVSPAGTLYHYVDGLDADGFEFHLAPAALTGVFPTHDGRSCVWVCAPVDDLQPVLTGGAEKPQRLRDLIAGTAPDLGRRLAGCRTSGVRGATALPTVVRRPVGPGWALVGDAGYHRDPITGHGITDAFRDAELLADACHDAWSGRHSESEAANRYDATRTLALREIFAITRELTAFPGVDRFADLQRRLSQAIEREAVALAARPAVEAEPVLAA
jgi:flavin-dependent dehydrogenase